jgi:ubiquitin-conjugating enzyme E2 J2
MHDSSAGPSYTHPRTPNNSITDYHPESWNPMWSVGTILTGLLSFMYDSQPTTGSITTTKAEKVGCAA